MSEILENILGLLALEGSFEVVEEVDEVSVGIDTTDPGRLIGYRGETVDSLQLLVNQILNRQSKDDYKRVVIDVGGWRKNKAGDLEQKTRRWAEEVLESKQPLELDPMPPWQRRIVHVVISEIEGVESESVGEGKDRHLVIKLKTENSKVKTSDKTDKA